jgi:hypothetical protein
LRGVIVGNGEGTILGCDVACGVGNEDGNQYAVQLVIGRGILSAPLKHIYMKKYICKKYKYYSIFELTFLK